MANQRNVTTLNEALDETITALTAFDAIRLEAVEHRLREMTVMQLAGVQRLPQTLEKHALLKQLLESTATNLKVLISVSQFEPRMETR